MPKMEKEKKFRSPVKKKLLLLLCAGVTIGLSRSARQTGHILRSIPREWRKIDCDHLFRLIKEFRRDRLVSYREESGGVITVVLTEAGKRRALRYNIDQIKIIKPKRWDGLWRVVIFDIPEKKRRARDALRLKLKELGFHEWQKSVFIHPYSCRDKIDFIIEFFEIRPFVRYAELHNPTNEADLKLHFNLY